MGKAYAQELASLGQTYAWAIEAEVDSLAAALARCFSHPMVAIGSGGALSAAHLATYLHEEWARHPSRPTTPLLATRAGVISPNSAVLLVSAGGNNPDILGVLQFVATREPRQVVILCGNPKSKLMSLASQYRYVDSHVYRPPAGSDGFLATNSLLGFALILCRAYHRAVGLEELFPSSLQELLGNESVLSDLTRRCRPLWERETLLVLHSPATQAAAIDLESKFTEAALGMVQLADYRNFGHGRHHWLAKRGSSSAVLAFTTPDDRDLADRTLRAVPTSVPVVRLDLATADTPAMVGAFVLGFHVVAAAGDARGIDPGRPGVPEFGRRIYGLRANYNSSSSRTSRELCAIERKTGLTVADLDRRDLLTSWKAAYAAFVNQLESAIFAGIVLDYDGTLVDPRERYAGMSGEVAREVERILDLGIVVGIASGRGRSVVVDLRTRIDRRHWMKIVTGCYNGASVRTLDDDEERRDAIAVRHEIVDVANVLRDNALLQSLATIEVRPTQVTITVTSPTYLELVRKVVEEVVSARSATGLSLAQSSHSLDVVARGVSKLAVVERVVCRLGDPSAPVLCIGDQGRWPGNDAVLLRTPYALSADEVSPDPMTCWNIAPAGHRGVQATLDYLRALRPDRSGARFSVSSFGTRLSE